MLRSYIAFDIETTGLSPAENEIIEIGALKVREGKVCERFAEFIKPNVSIPASITRLTGISNEMVDAARRREQVIPDFLQFCGDDVLIGHNILFDYSFVKINAKALGYSFEKQGIDTLKIARVVHKDLPSRSLGVLCEHYQIKNPAAHRAYHDALATAKLYQTLAHYYEDREPQIFQPSALVARSQKSLPATQKQRKLLERLAKERGREQTWEMEQLTRAQASRLIEAFLSGEEDDRKEQQTECCCKRTNCPRHGRCEECIAYHKEHKRYVPYCQRNAGKAQRRQTRKEIDTPAGRREIGGSVENISRIIGDTGINEPGPRKIK